MPLAELIGYIAAILMSISLAPQVIKSWRTKSTKDISVLWTLIYTLGLIFWLTYAILLPSYPLLLAASVEFLMTVSLLILKMKYK